ncbi:hypothetical protein PGRAT_16020 [Paenibacillus graminis]|uniref:Uncharacterized protein n=1 Tax=Paenibacillus graminis TaxID=189425 RepID=A0A089M5A1_9BACL|nr:hypothetical protein [Paenibacillus graminis]AIQ68961.1 hypothetical protein PGRAT_16020 [Paenibacillus graminis]
MKTHYYFSWFNEFFPEKLVHCLHEDIKDRKSQRDYAAFVQGYLFPLSEEIDVFAAEQESAIRVKDGKVDIMGPVYLISHSKIQKLVETL